MTDAAQTLIKFRDPRPPHGAALTILAPDIKYAFKVRKMSTASFALSRTDPNIATNLDKILTHEPAMVTIERPDGYMPWVGFVTQYQASQGDAFATFQIADHAWRMASPHGARTRKNQVYKTASGRVIRDVFRDMEDRAEPPLYLLYDDVGDGPSASYEVRLDYGLDALEALAQQTNYEWGFSYDVASGRVDTHLSWVGRLGQDRRDEEIWQEQKHFTRVDYTLNYANGIKSAVAVGGSGAFGARPAAAVNASGSAPDISATTKSSVSAFGLGGTRVSVQQQITDAAVLRQQATQMHEAPEYAVEQIGLTLLEQAIDMSRFALGDIRTIRLATTSLGSAIERVVRVIGIQFDPTRREIDIEAQVLT